MGVERTWTERPTELLFEWDFREHFRILNSIIVLLVDGDPHPLRSNLTMPSILTRSSLMLGSVSQFLHSSSNFFIILRFLRPSFTRMLLEC